MQKLIAVEMKLIAGVSVQTVNARELHAFLGVRKDFSSWIKDRIGKYGFVENQDFNVQESLSSPILVSAKARPQRTKEYTITLSMAQQLSMVERTPKGKEARLYFIECERKLFEHLELHQYANIDQAAAAKQNPLNGVLPNLSDETIRQIAHLIDAYVTFYGFSRVRAVHSVVNSVRAMTGVDLQFWLLPPDVLELDPSVAAAASLESEAGARSPREATR